MDTESLLDDFSWGEPSEDVIENTQEKGDETSDEEVEKKGKEIKKDPLDDTSFGDEEDEISEESSEEESTASIFKDHFSDLKERGIFRNVEIGEDEDIDADRFYELQEEEIEAEVSNRLQAWAKDELDEDAQAFLKFKREGGKTEDFFKVYSQSSDDLLNGDIEDPKYQEKIIRRQLEDEGWDEEEIEDRLETLADNGRMQKVAERYFNKRQEEAEKEKEYLLKQAEEQKEKARQTVLNFKSEVKETLDSLEDLKGFKITSKDKSDLLNYLTKHDKNVNGKPATGFQQGLAEIFKDKEKLILLSKLMQNNFDFSQIEKKAETKKVKEVKSKLEQRRSYKPSNSGSSLKGISVADLFS